MSQQVWTVKRAQDLLVRDLIPNQAKHYHCALEIKSVDVQENRVVVIVYSDLYKRFTNTYHMEINQHVPVARSHVNHMDEITTFEISEGV